MKSKKVMGLFFGVALLLLLSLVHAETIVFVGDSHVGGEFGNALQSQLTAAGHAVIKRSVDGSSISQWKTGTHGTDSFDSLGTLITTHSPNIVIISLGTNNLGSASTAISSQAQELVGVIPAATKCVWIGPPNVRETPPAEGTYTSTPVATVYNGLGSIGIRCTLIDSRSYTSGAATSDLGGIHYSGTAAQTWAQGVATQVMPQLGGGSGGASRGTPETNVCDTTTYSIPGQTGDPWIYGCVDATHGKACKKATGELNPSFVIPSQGYQRLLQQCSSGSAVPLPGSLSGSSGSCLNLQQCKEIDDVWFSRIGTFVRGSAEVWDVVGRGWKAFSILYPSALPSTTPPAYTSPVGGETTYDAYIREAAEENNVDFALVRAIMEHESRSNPNSISSTGCSGLLQICGGSAVDGIINIQCKQNRALGPQQCKPETCMKGRVAGSVSWCDTCSGNEPGCVPDQRFDPRRNIFSGTQTIKGKIDAVGASGHCGVACQIAAYNIGQCVINQAEGQSRPWDYVYGTLKSDGINIMDSCSKTYEQWDDDKKQDKINNLGGYVDKVMGSYHKYQTPPTS